MEKTEQKKIISDWETLSGESVKSPSNTFLDDLIARVNHLYGLRFKVTYATSRDIDLAKTDLHRLEIEHKSPDFVVMVQRYTGKIVESEFKDKVGTDFLAYLMFGKTVDFKGSNGFTFKLISVKDLIDKNY